MNVQEMHIEINISTQKIRSNYYRKFLDSEIDWLLNKHVDRFIKDRIKQDQDSLGFDSTEIDLDSLRTIVVLDREVSVFQVEDDAVRAELPGNYSYLIDDYSLTVDKCNIALYNAATKTADLPLYLYTFPLAQSTKVGAPYYQSMAFTLNSNSIFSVSGLPGLQDKTELFAVRNYILDQLSRDVAKRLQTTPLSPVDYYWEEFGSYRAPNSIIAVCSTQQIGLNQLTIDGTNITGTESIVTRTFLPIITGSKLSTDRLIRGAFRSQVRTSTFAGTKVNSPISAVSANQLKVYHDGKFIVSKLKMSYVRKPAKINLLLNQNCDLASEFHQEICDRVTLYIKELTMAPDWEIRMKDMMMNKD